MRRLEFRDVSFAYKANAPVIKGLSFRVGSKKERSGHIVALMGPSGCGKTTLLRLVLGLESIISGRILTVPSNPVVSYVPQEAVLFEHLTPTENASYFSRIGRFKTEFKQALFEEVSKVLELDSVLRSANSIRELSGGERQRIALLRALSIQPEFLLLDEPLTGLDAEVKKEFLVKLRELAECYDLMVVYVTHHESEARLIADEIAYMVPNEESGSVSRIVQEQADDFVNCPPFVEAAKAFSYPEVNILLCQVDAEGNMSTVDERDLVANTDCFMLAFRHDTVEEADKSGMHAEFIAKTPNFAYLRPAGGRRIVIAKSDGFPNKTASEKLAFHISGTAMIYDLDGFYREKITVKKGRICGRAKE